MAPNKMNKLQQFSERSLSVLYIFITTLIILSFLKNNKMPLLTLCSRQYMDRVISCVCDNINNSFTLESAF